MSITSGEFSRFSLLQIVCMLLGGLENGIVLTAVFWKIRLHLASCFAFLLAQPQQRTTRARFSRFNHTS